MTWPTDTSSTTHLDSSADDPSQARAEILTAITLLQSILAEVTAGNKVHHTADGISTGSWTPTIIGASGSPSYSSQTGHYTRHGKLVYVEGRVALSSVGTLTGGLSMGGLPFAAVNETVAQGNSLLADFTNSNMATDYNSPRVVLQYGGQTYGAIRKYEGALGSSGGLLATEITNTFVMNVQGWYRTA